MTLTKLIGQLFLAGVLGMVSVSTSYLSKINEKLDHVTLAVQEVAFKNEGKFDVIDIRLTSLEKFCPSKKRL